MKIVIDIDEVIYKYIKKFDEIPTCGNIVYDACITGIHKGKSIPEHHGRLIDADAFQKYCFNKNFDKRLSDGGLATINFFLGLQPTIIEGSESE